MTIYICRQRLRQFNVTRRKQQGSRWNCYRGSGVGGFAHNHNTHAQRRRYYSGLYDVSKPQIRFPFMLHLILFHLRVAIPIIAYAIAKRDEK